MANFRQFDGVDDVVASGSASSINPGASAWTFAAWVNPDRVDQDRAIMRVGAEANNSTTQHASLKIRDNGTLALLYVQPDNSTWLETGPAIAAGSWQRVFASRAASGVASVTIGVNAATTVNPTDPPRNAATSDLNIGGPVTGFAGGTHYDGGIAWAFWLQGVALSQAQVAAYLNNPQQLVADYGTAGAVTPNALRFLYGMQCDGATEADLSGQGAVATITGATRQTTGGPVLTTEWNPCITLSLFLGDNAVAGQLHGELELAAPAAATIPTGWAVAGVPAGRFARMAYGVERPTAAFGVTTEPSSGPDAALGDCFRTASVLNGSYAAGTWTVQVPMVAVDAGGANLRARVRLWRATDPSGAGATEITSGAVAGTTVTNLQPGTPQTSTVTLSLGAVTLTNEYLFLQLAAETV